METFYSKFHNRKQDWFERSAYFSLEAACAIAAKIKIEETKNFILKFVMTD